MEDDTRARRAPGPRPRAGNVVVPFPGLDTEERAAIARLLPPGRVLLLAFAAAAAVAIGLVLARETSMFAVERIDVSGGTPGVTRQVKQALADVSGRSLLKVDATELAAVVEALPTVREAALDRAFPNALRVVVVPERAVAVARQGAVSWLVSDRGRVMHRIRRGHPLPLPRIWVPKSVRLEPGGLASGELMTAVTAVAPLDAARFPGRVATVSSTAQRLTMRLRSGLHLQLGEPSQVRLKLAIAAKIMPLLEAGTVYLDVSVPERPVAGTTLNSEVEGEVTTSSAS
jgi:cell division protein FtsQ